MRILLAEPDAGLRTELVTLLQKWGYQCEVCADGKQASEQLQSSDPPRLALLEWELPGPDGIEICKMLNERDDQVFVFPLLLTTKESAEDEVLALNSGVFDLLIKPVNNQVLKARLSVGAKLARHVQVFAEITEVLDRHAIHVEELALARAKQLLQADRMCTLGMMAAGVAHEINNPASFISGNVQTLEMFCKDMQPAVERLRGEQLPDLTPAKLNFILDEFPKAISSIRNGVLRISRIVKGLRTYSGQSQGEKQEHSINDCVTQALEICHNCLKKQVKVVQNLALDMPLVIIDPQEVEQVLVNIFVNSADAMEPLGGGTLAISTGCAAGYVFVKVKDTGPGIPKEYLEKIWNPFFTTKEPGKGTGLGLAISHQIMANHGGRISATNAPEGGTEFMVEFPVKELLTKEQTQ